MQTTTSGPLSIRTDDDGTATLSGLAVPYDKPASIGGAFSEQFARGAVNVDELAGAPVLWNHDRAEVVGHIVTARNEDDGAHVDAVIQPTTRGKDAITLLRSGSIRGLSIGFEPVAQTWDGDAVTRSSVKVREVSLATIPAFEDAKVLAVRKEQPVPDTTTPEAAETREVAVDLTPISERIDQIEARMHTTAEPPAPTLSVREAFAAGLADAARTRQTRALADVVSSGNVGILPPQWSSEVRDYVDSERYVMASAGSLAFPSTGYTLTVPAISQHTLVGPRGTEKTEVPSRALTTASDTFTAQWFAGAVDVALELIEQSDPSVLSLLVSDMLRQYAMATETAVVSETTASATAAGRAIDTTSYATFIDDVWAEAENIRQVTGTPGNLLALTNATWRKLIGFVDTNGRRMLAPIGPGDADGTASILARSVDLGGIRAFYAPSATVDLQYNTVALRVAEKPPMQLAVDNPALMGRDIGILGAVLVAPFYPAGIISWTT